MCIHGDLAGEARTALGENQFCDHHCVGWSFGGSTSLEIEFQEHYGHEQIGPCLSFERSMLKKVGGRPSGCQSSSLVRLIFD